MLSRDHSHQGGLCLSHTHNLNLASQCGEAGADQLLFANLNQGNTTLAVGSKSRYKFFSLSSVDKLEQIYECADTEDVCIVERLFSSSLVAIVRLKAPRKLKVCHFKKGTEICNYSYSNTILAVKLNRQVSSTLPYKQLRWYSTCPAHRALKPWVPSQAQRKAGCSGPHL